MGNLMGIEIDWSLVDPEFTKTELKNALDDLVEDIEKNSNRIREFTKCTEYSLDKERFVSQYAEKLQCIYKIEELLLKIGVINADYIPNKIGLIELKSRIDLYKTKFAQSKIT